MNEELKYFNYEHLPEHLQKVAKPFAQLAAGILVMSKDKQQADYAVHYLLLAKDAAVRAAL